MSRLLHAVGTSLLVVSLFFGRRHIARVLSLIQLDASMEDAFRRTIQR